MDYQATAARVREFLDLMEVSFAAWNRGPDDTLAEIDGQINRRWPAIVEIAQRALPSIQTELGHFPGTGWRWRYVRPAAQMLLGALEDAEQLATELGPAGPQLSASSLHPAVWNAAARLWDGGHIREAVQAAATQLETEMKAKLGRHDLTGTPLAAAFATTEPKPGEPRLRFEGYEPESQDWKNAHNGARAFAEGCFLAIRNLATHRLDEVTPEEGLESLAALSLLARWLDASQVVQAE